MRLTRENVDDRKGLEEMLDYEDLDLFGKIFADKGYSFSKAIRETVTREKHYPDHRFKEEHAHRKTYAG